MVLSLLPQAVNPTHLTEEWKEVGFESEDAHSSMLMKL